MALLIIKGIFIQTSKLKEEFQKFNQRNHFSSIEQSLQYFSVFGGLELDFDPDTTTLLEEIQDQILDHYEHYQQQIAQLIRTDSIYHAVLSGAALGDAQTHTAYKRANIPAQAGAMALKDLLESEIVTLEHPKRFANFKADRPAGSDKLQFASPFLRFWFAFVSPIYKGISEGDYTEFKERFDNRIAEFSDQTFEMLSKELLSLRFQEDPLVDISSYWDKELQIDILAKSASGKVIAGLCKYTNTKLKKSVLSQLQQACDTAGIKADILVIFAKNGFSKELKSLKNDSLRLITLKNFKELL